MKCIFLAAGYATRLYPLTKHYPKPLLPVGGKPILDWLISDLENCTEQFIVVTNHKFVKYFQKWSKKRKNVCIIDDGTESNKTRLGAVKDIFLAIKTIDSKEDFLVIAGDNLLDFSLISFIQFAQKKDASCVMYYKETQIEKLQKTAVITINNNHLITSYEEKPLKPKSILAVPPFYYYKYKDIIKIPEALANGCEYDSPGSFAAWISKSVPMYAWKMTGNRYDIGDLKNYKAIKENYYGFY